MYYFLFVVDGVYYDTILNKYQYITAGFSLLK